MTPNCSQVLLGASPCLQCNEECSFIPRCWKIARIIFGISAADKCESDGRIWMDGVLHLPCVIALLVEVKVGRFCRLLVRLRRRRVVRFSARHNGHSNYQCSSICLLVRSSVFLCAIFFASIGHSFVQLFFLTLSFFLSRLVDLTTWLTTEIKNLKWRV